MTTWTRRAWLRGISASILAVASRDMYAHVSAGPVDAAAHAGRLGGRPVRPAGASARRCCWAASRQCKRYSRAAARFCPLQGALFGAVQDGMPRVNARYPLRLVSLSIDPLSDSPEALRAWLQRMGAGPNWRAVAPTGAVDDQDGTCRQGAGSEPRCAFHTSLFL
ncbi:hypothetical protein ACU4GD_19355 [Cupriavidus basilensis]